MPRRGASPTLQLAITPKQYEQAKQSHSGACLVADAIREQYPNLTTVSVDMATIRASDRERGERYIYLTPPEAQQALLFFDQGWPNPVNKITVRGAVKVIPITASPKEVAKRQQIRRKRLAELRSKQKTGKMTAQEKQALTRMEKAPPSIPRPSSRGAVKVVKTNERAVVVVGGNPPLQGTPHPNLLRGRNRHFGAKLADPGQVFREALEAAVEERLAERDRS
jgi:hypothetical protein